jgi:hypothetical protein
MTDLKSLQTTAGIVENNGPKLDVWPEEVMWMIGHEKPARTSTLVSIPSFSLGERTNPLPLPILPRFPHRRIVPTPLLPVSTEDIARRPMLKVGSMISSSSKSRADVIQVVSPDVQKVGHYIRMPILKIQYRQERDLWIISDRILRLKRKMVVRHMVSAVPHVLP